MVNPHTSPRNSLDAGEYTRFAGRPVPAHYGDPTTEYAALREGSAVVDRSYKTILRLTGQDPVGLLNAILTNDVPEEAYLGTYAALLNPKGRIQTDLRVLKSEGHLLIDTEPEGAAAAREILGRYAPFSRVKVENLSDAGWGILGLYGPRAKPTVDPLLGDLPEHSTACILADDVPVFVAAVATPVPGADFIGPIDTLRHFREDFVKSGAVPTGLDAYETARIAAGVPRFGADITPENFPAEAGILERAVSFSKGCYPGQETVARMRYRGHPNKTLHRLTLEGPPPAPDTPIVQNERQVGTITSTAPLPTNGRYLALGYLSRNAKTDAPLSAGEAAVLLAP